MASQFSATKRPCHQISPPFSSTAFASSLLRRTWNKLTKRRRRKVKQIDVLPDDVLLGIFDFCVDMGPSEDRKRRIEGWQSLVHVCRRWRSLVLGSPRRLNLRLCCTPETPVRDRLDVWPALPLIVNSSRNLSNTDNTIAALRQSNRVCQVDLVLAGWQLEQVLGAMQVPFPELTKLRLFSYSRGEVCETLPVIPDSFLDGSAPRLRIFELDAIPFPGFPKLHLSATHLVHLRLTNIPHSGYISPEAMIVLLSVLSSLRTLSLEFRSPQSRPDRGSRSLPPPKRSILPALDTFHFKGATEYLEDLVTPIDAPQVDDMHITFFNQLNFDCPRLYQFINRTPAFRTLKGAHVRFDNRTASVTLRRYPFGTGVYHDYSEFLRINISCREPDWQLSSIEQVCNSSLPPISTVEVLYIEHRCWELVWKNDTVESVLWFQLLLPFTAVKNLYLSKEFAPSISAALQELVGGRITEVLPSLQNIFVETLEPSGPFPENIRQFVAARLVSGHPVAVSVRKMRWM